MQKLSIILIMALILGLVPLISSPSTVRAEESSPTPAVTIAVYTVSGSVYKPVTINNIEKSFNFDNYKGEIRVEVTGDLHNYYVELTQKGVNVEATEISLEKLVFTKIYLNPSNLDEAFLLNIANYYLDEQAVYYIGNIPSNVGIAKIQLINSPLNLNGYKLKNELGAKNLSGATRIDTNVV
jgi:hypothetical protein